MPITTFRVPLMLPSTKLIQWDFGEEIGEKSIEEEITASPPSWKGDAQGMITSPYQNWRI
jgi:hypothetical protein